MDERLEKLADLLVGYSTNVKKGETVIIECFDEVPKSMANALVVRVQEAGGYPVVWFKDMAVMRKLIMGTNARGVKRIAESELVAMKRANAYIGIRAYANANEMSDVSKKQLELYDKHWWGPVHVKERVERTKWVVLRWPVPSMAQKFEMSTEAFEKFYFDVCTGVDYAQMAKNMGPLARLINKTDQVHIVGPGDTDITFSIKGIFAVECCGKRNIPDGEVFTAPVKESVNGVITYNTPTIYQGKGFNGIRLVFQDGKIVEATCESGDHKALNAIFDKDEGARFVGEFALGVNPLIKRAMREILFDEKIAGSIHFTPGNSYEGTPAYNGNNSNVHWDLVLIQTPEFGGGKIYFDDVLVRDNGLFVLPELKSLNP